MFCFFMLFMFFVFFVYFLFYSYIGKVLQNHDSGKRYKIWKNFITPQIFFTCYDYGFSKYYGYLNLKG